jgi:lipopolysaccharide transport system ATP-binding protein
MSDIAIRCEGLSKQYRIGERASYHSLRDGIADTARAPFRLLRSAFKGTRSVAPSGLEAANTFWALNDLSFEIKRGEVVGIIGRNGAGKSTLLKILSRITAPTKGEVEIRGRVGSLLEVGTGFHPELSGRENIFLNGAILGMRKAEIAAKFDEIVAFAEIEKFIDTPVKRYSSGMYVRLAFAVAAHMEPEILLVDEVLAVGDAAFQKKCLGKMGDVAKGGRTILFVSHSMAAVTRLCRRGIVLDAGKVILNSGIFEATSKYLQSDFGTSAERRWHDIETAPGDSVVKLQAVRIISEGAVKDVIDIRRPVAIEMEYWNFKPDAQLVSVFSFINEQGVMAFISIDQNEQERAGRPKPVGLFRSRCVVPGNLFSEGQFRVVAEVSTSEPMYEIHVLEFDSVCFQVVDTGDPGSVRAGWGREMPGVLRPMLKWENEYLGVHDHALNAPIL